MNILLLKIFTFFMIWTGKTSQVENYYFPVEEFSTEKVYCFVNKNDHMEKSYWKMRTIISNGDTVLQTSIYDSKNRLNELMSERIQNGNSKILHYTLYRYDQQGNRQTSDCKILESSVFNAQQKVNEEIQWKVNFKDFNSSNTCELSKTRTLKSMNNNQKTFNDLMKYKNLDTQKGYQYQMISVYQKGKGLIAYRLFLHGGKEKDFVLTDK